MKKWDEQITMSEHISSFLHLHHCINNSGQKLDDIHIVYAILLSLQQSGVQDVVKQNLLDKGTALNLDIVTTELLSVHDYMEREHNIEETKKKQKAEQLALFAKSFSSGEMSGGFSGKKKSKKVKYKSKLRPADMSCHIYGEKGH